MTITLNPGEIKQVNVALSPTPVEAAVVMLGVRILDKTAGIQYDSALGPIAIPRGNLAHPVMYGVNNTDTKIWINLHCWAVSPSGAIVGEFSTPWGDYSKGKGGILPYAKFGCGSEEDVIPDEIGTWHYIEQIEFQPGSPVVPVVNGDWLFEVV